MEPLEPRLALSGLNAFAASTAPMPPIWDVAPYATSPTSISMSVTASHETVEVEYYFQCTTDTSQNSGWQNSTTYAAWNLAPETAYSFQAKVREKNTTNESGYSDAKSATTQALPAGAIAEMTEAVQNITNQIRAIETWTNPNNPGHIVAQLRANDFPDPTAANTPLDNPPPTEGLATYPVDNRNTPGAFQVDIANFTVPTAGVTPATTDYFERFGEWKGTAGSTKNANLTDTQIAFSKATLEEYFDIIVGADGLITSISAPSASVFLHDDSLAAASTEVWNPTDNQLIGLHIDGFQSEQLSLYLAGREATDGRINITDPRTAPESVMAMSAALENQVSKDYIWGSYRDALSNWLYGSTYRNAMNLFGATLKITSSSTVNVFGVTEGQEFYCQFNPAFVMGGTYVSGSLSMYNLLQALVQADETGYGTWQVDSNPNHDVHFELVDEGPLATDKVFTVDKTPLNYGPEFPTIFHYGAVLSPYGVVDQATAYMVGVADAYAEAWGYEGRNVADGLGYTRLEAQAVSGAAAKSDGGLYVYSDLESGGTLALSGSETFIINATTACTITADGYPQPCNSTQRVPAGRLVDVSDYVANGYITASAEDILASSFYSWWGAGGQQMARVNDASVPSTGELTFYFVPAAKDEGPAYVLEHMGEFWDSSSPMYHSARILVANVDVLGRAPTAAEWAAHFSTFSSGTGVIDASATTGNVFIVADKSIETIILGSGTTTVLAAPGLTSEKTFVLNADTTNTPTLDLRKGDTIDWSNLPTGLTWEGGTALTFDSTTTALPYLRYSYIASWTGKDGATTEGAFEAIVRANQNTGDYNPVTIVETALGVSTTTTALTVGPTISKIAVGEAFNGSDRDGVKEETDSLVITWNLAGDTAVAYTSVTIDGTGYTGHAVGNTGNYYALIGTQATGTHNFTISATNGGGTSSGAGSFKVSAASASAVGPTISKVAVGEAFNGSDRDGVKEETDSLVMTWNLAGDTAVTSTSVTIDGTGYTGHAVGNTGNYYALIGTQATGTHNFTISATNGGGTSNGAGSFKVSAASASAVGPTISKVVVAEAFNGSDRDGVKEETDSLVMTWNLAGNTAVTSTSVTIDGTGYTGRAVGNTGNYYALIGTQATGTHNYAISATDGNGTCTSSGSFKVVEAFASAVGPTISKVVVAEAFNGSNTNGVKETTDRLLVTWKASSNQGIASKTLTVEGQVINVGGSADPGYYGLFGPLSAGDYGYTITVTDYNGLSDSYNGTFTVSTALTLDTSVAANGPAAVIGDSDLAAIAAEAALRLERAFGSAAALILDGVTVELTDLPGNLLGLTSGDTIQIDVDAAGRGWFVDPTPEVDEEFGRIDADTLAAIAGETSYGRADLLTAVMHEMGHVLGFDHAGEGLMDEMLSLGVRQLPNDTNALDLAFASLED